MASNHSSDRDREAHVIIGQKGQGKSPYIKYLIDKTCDLRRDKVLIVCASTPKSFENYTRITNINSLRRPWHGVFLYYGSGNEKDMLVDILRLVMEGYFSTGGAIFFDDCTPYLDHNPSQAIKSFLTHHKNMGVDLYFVCHSIRLFSSFCRKMVSSVTLFKTKDTFTSPRDFIGLNYPNGMALYEAYLQVGKMPETKSYIQPHKTISTGA